MPATWPLSGGFVRGFGVEVFVLLTKAIGLLVCVYPGHPVGFVDVSAVPVGLCLWAG